MRVDAITKYHFPFEYWTLAVGTNGVTSFVKSYEAVGLMLPGQAGGIYLITKDQMQIPMQVRNLRDRSGSVVTQAGGVEYPLYVHTAEPQLDPFSNVVAWKHTLRRDPPRDYSSFFEEILSDA